MSMGLIVAICGESGAGKSTTTGILRDLGFAAYSLSGFLREEAEAAYRTPTREQVQTHARAMQRDHGNAYYARKLLDCTDVLDRDRAVVDGMRNPDEIALLRDAADASGATLILLALVLDGDRRFERVQGRGRGGDPAEKALFFRDDARANGSESGFQNNQALIAAADHRIENTGDPATLRAKVKTLVEEVSAAVAGRISA